MVLIGIIGSQTVTNTNGGLKKNTKRCERLREAVGDDHLHQVVKIKATAEVHLGAIAAVQVL
jgi:hypothetical protein